MALSKPNFTLANKEWLSTAVNYCQGAMMDIGKFAKVIKHEICQETFDMFYVSLMNGYSVYLSKDIIKWFGYSGTDRDQKTLITNILKNNYIRGSDWFIYSQKEYKTLYNEINPMSVQDRIEISDVKNIQTTDLDIFIDKKELPMLPHPSESSNKTNHYIINSNIFKKVILRSDSPKSEKIRDYYINLEDLIFKFMEYTMEMRKTKSLSLIDKMEQIQLTMKAQHDTSIERIDKVLDKLDKSEHQVDKLDKKLDNVLPNKVDLEKLPDDNIPHVIILRDQDAKEDECNYYVMRTQTRNISDTIKSIRSKYGDNIRKSYTIKQPNAIAFWTIIKRKYKANILKDPKSNWFKLVGISQREFYTGMNKMNDERMSK